MNATVTARSTLVSGVGAARRSNDRAFSPASFGCSSADLGRLLEQSPIGAIAADSSYIITDANMAAIELLGLRSMDVIGQHLTELLGSRFCRLDNDQPLFVRQGEALALTRCKIVGPAVGSSYAMVSIVAAPWNSEAGALVSITPTTEVEQQVVTDPLTGLFSRSYFDRQAVREFHRLSRKSGCHLSLAVIDIDLFKKVNDRYGHDAGDRVLRTAARVIQRMSRDGDIAARYGGEEFVVIMPDTDLDGAMRAAERIRLAVAACEVALNHGRAIEICRPTISVGIATAVPSELIKSRDDAGTADVEARRLFVRADAAMYAAKSAGRNRTACADEQAASTPW